MDSLKIGDSLIFLNRDDDTRDIVDYVLKELIRENASAPKPCRIMKCPADGKTI